MDILAHIPTETEILARLNNLTVSDPEYEYYCALLGTHTLIEDSRICDYPLTPDTSAIDYYPMFSRETIKKLSKHGYTVKSVHKFHCKSWIWVSRMAFH